MQDSKIWKQSNIVLRVLFILLFLFTVIAIVCILSIPAYAQSKDFVKRLNEIRANKNLPTLKYYEHKQKSCDAFVATLVDSMKHSDGNYGEVICKTYYTDALEIFQSSPSHWQILMDRWITGICIAQKEINGITYTVARTY